MRQALEALESYHGYMEPLTTVFGGPRVPAEQSTTGKVEKAITALRTAIEQAEKQEPVAWMYWQSCLNDDGTQTAPWVQRYSKFKPPESVINKEIIPLYTTPPAALVQEPVAWPIEEDVAKRIAEKQFVSYEVVQLIAREILATPPAAPVQEPAKLRRGDILRCIESDELCTVWATSTTGKTLVKWSGNAFGDYTAEQIGELFWLEPESDDVEIAAEQSDNYAAFHAGVRFARVHPPAAQRQWVGLTDESVVSAAARVLSDRVAASCNVDCGDQWMLYGNDYIEDARAALEAAEAKLREKNTGETK